MAFTEPFDADMTLEDAQALLRTLIDGGHKCPLCTQFAKVYKRKIHGAMAAMLIRMWKRADTDWLYLPDLPQRSRDGTGLAWWGLIEEERVARPDGGRAGWWRVTAKGVQFIQDQTTVQTYAHVYDGRCLKFSGEARTLRDCLGSKFNYGELMAGG